MPRLIDRLTTILPKRGQRARSNQETHPVASFAAQSNSSPALPNPKILRQAYLNSLITKCRSVSIASQQFSGNDPASSIFLLDRLYVTPDTCTRIEPKRSEGEPENNPPVSAVKIITHTTDQRMVLLGSPGSGKSTFLCFLALQHARALNSAEMDIHGLLPDWSGPPVLPVLIPLNRLSESLDPQASPSDGIIEHFLQTDENTRLYAPHLLEEVDRNGGLFLFDGLDEIADPACAPQINHALQAFVLRHSTHPATRFIVTCRTLSYEDPGWQLAGWVKHELAPFNEAKIRQFIETWYDEILRLDPARRAYQENKRAKLLSYLLPGDPNRLLEFASNPLVLTSLAAAHADKSDLPETRVLIYQECLDHLLTHWAIEPGLTTGKFQIHRLLDSLQIPQQALEHILQEIAYRAHTTQPEKPTTKNAYPCTLIPEELLSPILLTRLGSAEKVQIALVYFRQPNGILTVHRVSLPKNIPPDGSPTYDYAFLHPAMQEYLAAVHLANKADLGFEARHHISRSIRWREVLLLLGEYICYREADDHRMDAILNALAPAPLPQEGLTPDEWRAIWMAGELLHIYRRTFPQRAQEHKHIPRGLVNLLQARGASRPASERAASGDVLDLLGDPRFRPDAWYLADEALLGFLLIPDGPFYMGSDLLNDPAARESEQPQHEISLPAYYIARHLVTVAQFKAFVEDSGYQLANTLSLNGRLSHPVVYVSWQDAMRYCEWLTEKLKEMASRRIKDWVMSETGRYFWEGLENGGLVAALPSEAEWEKAARGAISSSKEEDTDHRSAIYPWGNEFDTNKANTAETGLGTTSPVGCFTMGASPYGVLDMAGNVWEWTRTLWGTEFAQSSFFYPYNPSDGRENLYSAANVLRVIRGGSFFYHSWHTRISSRGRSLPPELDWDIGFRVAVTALKNTDHRSEKW